VHVCRFTDLVVLVSHSFIEKLFFIVCSVLFIVRGKYFLVHPLLIFYADES